MPGVSSYFTKDKFSKGQGSPAGCDWLEVPRVSQVARGGRTRHS